MTIDALAPWYPWVKSMHLLGAFAWMAGLFYLPRLYVYHCQVAAGSAQSELFKVMERRLLRAIMNPAMIWTWAFGAAAGADARRRGLGRGLVVGEGGRAC